ncbi:hypothetical protein CIB48_g5771 [Xylaria polymorpha]|nr:hypothetical protein CIB48_g5771 [Xylaria polymorpha]
MLFAIFFAFWRFLQIITLIPTIGLLAYFVDGYNKLNALTPTYILVLFIVSVLAGAWADLHPILVPPILHKRDLRIGHRPIIRSVDVSLGIFGSASLNGVDVSVDKSCAMLKAAFAFGILNTIFFFFTAILAWMHGDRVSARGGDEKTYVRENHSHRHSHRSSQAPHSRHSSHHSHRRV